MASTTVSHQKSANKPQPRLNFIALAIRLISLEDREPAKGRKEHRGWEQEYQSVWSEIVPAVFSCFPEGTGFDRKEFSKLIALTLSCVRGGMIYQKTGAPPIVT
jgi:hypothetical protein